MEIVTTVAAVREAVASFRAEGSTIGLVPTMGFLHEGHRALMRASRAESGATIVSLFVNPTQFGPSEDFATYPRDPASDAAICEAEGVAVLFAPPLEEVYPPGFQTHVEPGPLADGLCGRYRPGHFRGVATVVAKLFAMVGPDAAFFGRKDFQQAAVIRRMVRDLDMNLAIRVVPTVREPDGMALSSRNAYLSAEERGRARCLSRGLFAAEAAFAAGERDSGRLTAVAQAEMGEVDRLQYLELVDADSLAPLAERVEAPAALCVAAFVGRTRLIDNVVLGAESA